MGYNRGDFNRTQLWEARERFAELLQKSDTKESIWQHLFTECPYILSRSLPLKLLPDDIQPLGRTGRSEPDFIFYPRHVPRTHDCYGVIELKTPQARILTAPRKNIITLSRSASTAVAQGEAYLKYLNSGVLIQKQDDVLFIGTNLYVFIIMGRSQEIRDKLTTEMLDMDLCNLLPNNFSILPYDYLYSLFEASIPPRIMIAVVPILAETSKEEFSSNKEDLSSNFMKCPECQKPMYEATVDRWYYHESGTSDSDGPHPRYVDGYRCSECAFESVDYNKIENED